MKTPRMLTLLALPPALLERARAHFRAVSCGLNRFGAAFLLAFLTAAPAARAAQSPDPVDASRGPAIQPGVSFARFTAVRAGEVAIRGQVADRSELIALASRLGLGAAQPIPGGRGYARFTAPPGTEKDVAESLARDPEVLYATPVYEGEAGFSEYPIPFILLRFGSAVPDSVQRSRIESVPGVRVVETRLSGMEDAWRLRADVDMGEAVLALVRALGQLEGVRWVEPDAVREGLYLDTPQDPLFANTWGLENSGAGSWQADFDMDACGAWDRTLGAASSIVVILDDGVQQNHPDINQIGGVDFTGSGTNGGPGSAEDCHGTAVAGCVAGRANTIGTRGIAPGARIASARFSTKGTSTTCQNGFSFFTSDLTDAIDWSTTLGAAATCSSFSVGSASAISDAYEDARDTGVVHFAATGNDSASTISFPASDGSVNGIGSANPAGVLATSSNTGTGIFAVAPGDSSQTTDRTGTAGYNTSGGTGGDYAVVGGTSFASPYAAGVAALIHSIDDSLTPDNIEDVLDDSAADQGTPGYDTSWGHGLVNAARALDFVGDVYMTPGPGGSGTGTFANPYTSVFDAEAALGTNDALIIRSGTYSVGAGITFDKPGLVLAPTGGAVLE